MWEGPQDNFAVSPELPGKSFIFHDPFLPCCFVLNHDPGSLEQSGHQCQVLSFHGSGPSPQSDEAHKEKKLQFPPLVQQSACPMDHFSAILVSVEVNPGLKSISSS